MGMITGPALCKEARIAAAKKKKTEVGIRVWGSGTPNCLRNCLPRTKLGKEEPSSELNISQGITRRLLKSQLHSNTCKI